MRTARIIIFTIIILAAVAAFSQTATRVNDTSTNPAAPIGTLNVTPQNDHGTPTVNTSHYVTYPTLQVACPNETDLSDDIMPVLGILAGSNGGVIDARLCKGASYWSNNITIMTPNITLLLPCTNIAVTGSLNIEAGTRNVKILGCGYMGGTGTSGQQGGTDWIYEGTGRAFTIGDPSYSVDTPGAEIGDMSIVSSGGTTIQPSITFYRAQDLYVHDIVLNGSGSISQIGIMLDGSGNYTGGEFRNIKIEGMGEALWMSGGFYDSVADSYANASTFTRLHIDCPTSAGSPIAGTYGINLLGGDGNTFIGGDVEGCDTMLHLGASATSNTFTGLRWENSNYEITAEAGSAYNLLQTGTTIHTGKLTDAGTYNSFIDTFHHSTNALKGDRWMSQADTSVTNHINTGIGLGNVRGRQDEYQTDVPGTRSSYQYMWLFGPGDGTAGVQEWQLRDQLNGVNRFFADTATTAGGNNQTGLNSQGSGALVFNASANSGTGGIIFDSGGAAPTQVASIDSSGNYTQFGYHRFYGSGVEAWRFDCASTTVCNLNSMTPTANVHHFRMYNGAGTEIDSEGTGDVEVNSTSTSGTGGFVVHYGGANSATKSFSVTGTPSAPAYGFFGITAPASTHRCLHIDDSGYMTITGSDCGSSNNSGTVTNVSMTTPTDITVVVTNAGTTPAIALTWTNTVGPTSATYAAYAPWSGLSGIPGTFPGGASGEAATAGALYNTPTLCNAGYAPTGITAAGNATGCAQLASAHWTTGTGYLPAATTDYVGSASLETGSEKDPWIAPRAGTVQECYAALSAAQGAAEGYTLYLYKNGSICAGLTIQFFGTSAYQVKSDTTNSCTIAAGDELTWEAVYTSTATTTMASISCLY